MLGLLYEVPAYYFLPATWASRTIDVRERYAARGLRFATPSLLYYYFRLHIQNMLWPISCCGEQGGVAIYISLT